MNKRVVFVDDVPNQYSTCKEYIKKVIQGLQHSKVGLLDTFAKKSFHFLAKLLDFDVFMCYIT